MMRAEAVRLRPELWSARPNLMPGRAPRCTVSLQHRIMGEAGTNFIALVATEANT